MAHNLPRLFLPQRKLRLVAQAHRKRPAPEAPAAITCKGMPLEKPKSAKRRDTKASSSPNTGLGTMESICATAPLRSWESGMVDMVGLSEGTGAKEWHTEMVLIFLSQFITIINLINIKRKLKSPLFRLFKQTIATNQKRMIFR